SQGRSLMAPGRFPTWPTHKGHARGGCEPRATSFEQSFGMSLKARSSGLVALRVFCALRVYSLPPAMPLTACSATCSCSTGLIFTVASIFCSLADFIAVDVLNAVFGAV